MEAYCRGESLFVPTLIVFNIDSFISIKTIRFPFCGVLFYVIGNIVHFFLITNNVVMVACLPFKRDVIQFGITYYGRLELSNDVRQSTTTFCSPLHFQIDFFLCFFDIIAII